MMTEKLKTLDAKVQIHRLAKEFRNISDLPYKTEEEVEKEEAIIKTIAQITNNVIFKNEVDKKDFEDYLEEQLAGQNFDLQEPEGEKIDDESLTEVLQEDELEQPLPSGEAIDQIKNMREKRKTVQDEIKELQQRKKQLKEVKHKDNLKKEIDKMEEQIREEQKEESFLTEKKNKEGIVELRHEKYNKRMDDLNWEKSNLEDLLKKTSFKPQKFKEKFKDMLKKKSKNTTDDDEEEIKTIMEALKINKGKRYHLKKIKAQTYFQKYMIKIPKWISSSTKQIGEFSDGLGKMGGDMGKYDTQGKGKGNMSGLMVGGNDSNMDFGFNPKDMFGSGKEKKEPKKRKAKRKRKRKSKRK